MLQKRLGEEVTVMVHGREAYNTAIDASNILFGKSTKDNLVRLDEATLLNVFEGVPTFEIPKDGIDGCKAVELLTEKAKCFSSKSELRKLVLGGGVSINKEKLTDPEYSFSAKDLLDGKYILVQRGKKNYFLIIAK